MKLTYYSGATPNFGDALNPYMWPRILPGGFLDEDDDELFLGIGSILWDHRPATARKYVMGSGYGGYARKPDISDGRWEFAFVRGPRTAAHFGLPDDKAIADSAVLLRTLSLPAPTPGVGIAFMPHYHSFSRGPWEEVCRMAGLRLIDPRDAVEKVLADIAGASMLITEAMHGAIVADALRTPWLAVHPIHPENQMKWLDWAESLDLKLDRKELRPSSLLETYIVMTEGRRYYEGRATRASKSTLAKPLNAALAGRAARRLRALSRMEPQLSRDDRIGEVTERAAAAVDSFVRTHTK